MPRFAALHARVIGVSMDGIGTLKRFSVSECRSRFPVGADTSGAVSRAYDAVLIGVLGLASRTSYVIAPNGRILTAYSAMDPDGHVGKALRAVDDWASTHPGS